MVTPSKTVKDLAGQLVVTMVVGLGPALLNSEAALPVSRAWVFHVKRSARW